MLRMVEYIFLLHNCAEQTLKSRPGQWSSWLHQNLCRIIITTSFQQTTRGYRAAGISCRLCVDLHYSLLCHQVVQASVFILVLTTSICSQGTNIKLAQHIFSALYLINLALVFRIMVKTRKVCLTSNSICLRMKFGCNRHKHKHMVWKIIKMILFQVPPYVLVLMSVTSYRIHSIFVLR